LTLWPSFPNGNLPPTRIGHSATKFHRESFSTCI